MQACSHQRWPAIHMSRHAITDSSQLDKPRATCQRLAVQKAGFGTCA